MTERQLDVKCDVSIIRHKKNVSIFIATVKSCYEEDHCTHTDHYYINLM